MGSCWRSGLAGILASVIIVALGIASAYWYDRVLAQIAGDSYLLLWIGALAMIGGGMWGWKIIAMWLAQRIDP